MSDTIIRVENVSKQYRLGQIGTGTIRSDFNRWWHKVRGKEDPYLKIGEVNDRTVKGNSDFIWALQDINFEIKRGDVMGIIGRNGAGKSTLLKLLSRTVAPTSGKIYMKGRVASLLEVGTGFHGDLSGRENIYLNGSILGMSRKEINSKFDEIVDFAAVERYIDTPVKRYSSGMYVRLAFAVAAHLEPEILIVDEVLAVGDAEFQEKCLGKIKSVNETEGRTILFVSHNMSAVSTLTKQVMLLDKGRLEIIADTEAAIEFYQKKAVSDSGIFKLEHPVSKTSITYAEVCTKFDNYIHQCMEPLAIKLGILAPEGVKSGVVSIKIVNHENKIVAHAWNFAIDTQILKKPGLHKLTCNFPKLRLYKGSYTLHIVLSENSGKNIIEVLDGVCLFHVDMIGHARSFPWEDNEFIYMEDFSWETTVEDQQG